MANIDKSKPTFGPLGGLFRLQRVVIFALAGLLVFYHTYTLFALYVGSGLDLYGGPSANGHPLYMHTHSILRLLIIVSLVLVAMNRRSALYGMWAAIGALVATHYWAYFFDLPFPFLERRHPLSFLKGFIIPTVNTLLYLSTNSRRNPGCGLTPRSSRAPTASHRAGATVQYCIFCSAGPAFRRRCRLNSNVRPT